MILLRAGSLPKVLGMELHDGHAHRRTTTADLKDRRGEQLSFTGKLVKCEPYMHTLYVASVE